MIKIYFSKPIIPKRIIKRIGEGESPFHAIIGYKNWYPDLYHGEKIEKDNPHYEMFIEWRQNKALIWLSICLLIIGIKIYRNKKCF